jgi:AraC family transcriptional activator FtrA
MRPQTCHPARSGCRTDGPLVVAIAFDRLPTFEFGCVVELFGLSRPELEDALTAPWYRFAVTAIERGPLRATGGISISAPYRPALLDRADLVIVPGWRDAAEIPPPALLDRLRRAHARGARIASICSGAFVLAAAGLLDGRRATTHWRYAEALSQRYPQLEVDTGSLYVDEGQILTSAGSAAGMDMMLHLIRRDHGSKVANLVAQRLVMPPHREGGQAQFVPRPVANDEAGRLAKLLDWVRANPALPHTLDTLAERAAVSTRTLQRHFVQTTGYSPSDWLVRERVAIARELLESSGLPLDEVGRRAGFGSDESFRRHFRIVTRASPGAYRRQFGGRDQ